MNVIMYKQSLLQRISITLLGTLSIVASANTFAYEKQEKQTDCDVTRQFTFSWSLMEKCNMKPRGGSSKGVKSVVDPEPHPGWLSLQEEGLSQFEKDRKAILAMAGPYRVSFDFLEIEGYTTDYEPSRPYQSWGTEYVYVAEDKGDFISLQHIMVMYFQEEDGSVSEPMVMKHWRQDWQYENQTQFVFTGQSEWQQKQYTANDVKGTWSQSVFQVDDSPRYASFGKWEHHANFSSWKSGTTWRPLPRREGSVRDDYHVLQGTNRHTILPSGWVQQEENLKMVLNDNGELHQTTPYLSKELGIARYERIVDHDFAPGDAYWEKSGPFWSDVRYVWNKMMQENDSMVIHKKANGQFMFMPMFNKAQAVADGAEYNSEEGRKAIQAMLAPYIQIK